MTSIAAFLTSRMSASGVLSGSVSLLESILLNILPTARLLFIFISVTLLVRIFQQKKVAKLPLPPGPRGIPIFGFLPFLGKNFHLTLTQLAREYGPIYQIFLGGKRIVVVNDSRIVRQAFRQPVFSGRPDTELTKILQGYGIINSEGELWSEQRAFLHAVLRQFGAKSSLMSGKYGLEHKIRTQVSKFMEELSHTEGKAFRFRPIVSRAVSNVVGSLLMSTTFQKNDTSFDRLLELMEEGMRLVTVAMPCLFVPILVHIPGMNFAFQKIKKNREETGNYFKNIMDEHRKSLDETCPRDVVDAYLVQQDKVQAEGKASYFSEVQLIQIMNDIFSAGLETVTSTLEWTMLFLVRNPRVQKEIQAELDRVVGANRAPELEDMPQMPFTEATIYETLRRSNVVVLGNAHATLEDAELYGYSIPKNTHVLPNLYAIHMDPQLWDEPEEFVPERFLREGKIFKPDYFMPFSVGRRMCLGDVLTKMEVFLFLSTLLNEYDLSACPFEGLPVMEGIPGASMSPKPFNMILTPRAHRDS